jgi:hypothetical protein
LYNQIYFILIAIGEFMQTIVVALLPIFFLILLGYTFKKIEFPSLEFWQYADKFTYYALFPAFF